MKKLLPVLWIVLGVVGLLGGIGLVVDEQHELGVTAAIRAEPDEVWKAVSEVERWPEWFPEVDRVTRAPSRTGKPVWRTVGDWGTIDFEVVVLEAPYDLELLATSSDFTGRWKFTLEPVPAGVELTITEKGEIANPLVRGLSVFRDGHSTMKAFHAALGEKFGVDVRPREVEIGD